jgi:two-component system, sensor histidine kinase PdtaS
MKILYRQTILIGFIFLATQTWSQSERQQGLLYYHQSLDKGLPFQKTIFSGLKSLHLFNAASADSLKALAHIQLGILYWHDGQFDSSWNHIDKGQQIVELRKEYIKVAQCLHYKGLVRYYQCNFREALNLYERAEGIFEEIKADSALAKLKSHKGLIYSATGQYKKAIQNTLESFKLQEALPSYRDMTIPMQFSSAADETLYYKSKLEKDSESLQFVEQTKDKVKKAFTLYNLGLDYLHLKKYTIALKYFKQHASIQADLGYPTFTGSIADAYVGLGNYDSAIYYHKKWIAEAKERGTQIYLAAAYTNLAACYRSQQNWKEALAWFELANELNKKMGLKRSEAVVGKTRAQLLLNLGQVAQALQEIEISLSIANQIGCIKDVQEFLEVKSAILVRAERHKEAAQALTQSIVMLDSITDGEGQLQVARLQIEYETEKKNRDLTELQSQNKLKQVGIESRNLQIALAFSLLTLIAIVGSFYYFRYRQKKKSSELLTKQKKIIEVQNEELQKQNREKGILLSEIHHRVKNNLQIISSLISLKSRQVSAETNEALQQLNGRIFSMGLIHDKLYRTEDIQNIRLDEYLTEVSQQLITSFEGHDHPITLNLNCQAVEISADKALTCGLIANELITNAVKYAFTAQQQNCEITVGLIQSGNMVSLQISDNGSSTKPISGSFNKSFGSRFVDQLVIAKLGGEWSVKLENGVHIIIKFTASLNETRKN